jgi:hypothetical protein
LYYLKDGLPAMKRKSFSVNYSRKGSASMMLGNAAGEKQKTKPVITANGYRKTITATITG